MHFFTLNPADPKIFGFAEYIAALALMVLAWTTVDYRYRFRVETARYDIRRMAFAAVWIIGVLTLVTDVWRASGWPVWEWGPITPVVWQGLLGLAFLATFMTWALVAFVRPPKFNEGNADRFQRAVLLEIKGGDKAHIALMADALVPSAPSIVRLLSLRRPSAEQLLSLLSDPVVCSVLVTRSPALLAALYEELHRLPVNSRATYSLTTNVLSAAVAEGDSFLHREVRDWTRGAASSTQPVTRTVFRNLVLLDQMPGIFNAPDASQWQLPQWRAFFRAAGMTLGHYITLADTGRLTHSFAVDNIFEVLKAAPGHVRLNLASGQIGRQEAAAVLRELILLVKEVSDRISDTTVEMSAWRGLGEYHNPIQHLARVAYHILLAASYVKAPAGEAWHFGYGIAWSGIFDPFKRKAPEKAFTEVQELVARMVWLTITELDRTPNFYGAQLLALCINIGLITEAPPSRDKGQIKPSDALLRLVTGWLRRRFAWLYNYNPTLAVAGFADGVSYNKERRLIIRERAATAFDQGPRHTSFAVRAAPRGSAAGHLLGKRTRPFSPPNNRRKIPDWPWF
ncbi:hypothetical protein ROV93_17870 [Stenotrophomonas maltophilia group sp. msm4]|jgi:hypothetical protein|uniref:hypothetical protein n=1 Tax=Stenotrophomonas maltophilia group sp. msm4 TaxID=3061100 RepID=UPI0028960B9E|nr:hypothetical protein [Stenotrophomonas maltophilia group sp. msm4]MDT3491991.1 hypothetical protein [Stenotrophomonas maltophilia group sp. msm4]